MAEVPPTLLHMDPPLLVDGPPEVAAAAAALAAKRVGLKGAEAGMDDIVNSMLPPRMWTQKDGTVWMQYTSKEPSSRVDVLALQHALNERLAQRQARQAGLCPVREDLFKQAFDELIRQVAISSPERGLLLLRLRDELRMTGDSYRALYESSAAFSVRKLLQAEQGVPELEAQIAELAERKKALEAQVLALRSKMEMVERRQAERRVLEEKRRQEEVSYLKHQAKHLDLFLKSVPKI